MIEQRSLVDVVGTRVAERPGETVYTFVDENGDEGASVTWRDLDRRARAIGARLQAARATGERAVLVYPPGIDFIAAFLGCLYGGTVAVPVHPPRRGKPDARLAAIVADARPHVALTTRAMHEQVESWAAQVRPGPVRVITTDDLPDGEGDAWQPVQPAPDRLAFLQYTSGSTATPKGVMVTHGNLLHNEEAIRRAFGQSESSVIVSWLPLYHDMGLIGGVLQPLYAGGRCVLMSPLTFLQTPSRWLDAITRYGGTTSGGPNFAYELCIRRIGEAERARLDLSSWSVAFNGAEPVRAETLRRFAEAFGPAGFDGAAFRPCYGLAEATLLVAAHRPGRPATADVSAAGLERGEARAVEAGAGEPARTLVSCGVTEAEHRVVVVDPETRRPSAPGHVGEIWVSGPSVAAGYWNRPDATDEVFRARLADGGDASAFLRTGDLGFVRDGDLFVAGRLKDLIIVRGRNFHPHDVELTAEKAHASVRPGSAAAFPVEVDGEERLVVACEIERHPRDDARSVAEAVRRAVSDEHQLAAHDVVLLRAGTLPKTSSGKIRRHACREAYAAGGWEEVARTRPAAADEPRPAREDGSGILALVRDMDRDARLAVVSALCRREVARVARVETSAIDPGESLTRLGVESLGAVELMHTLERELGISVPIGELLRGPSLAELAERVVRGLESPSEDRPLARQGSAAPGAEYPLSYGQRALWFVHRLAPGSGAYNVAAAAWVRSELDVPALCRACDGLVSRHISLRSTFHETPGDPVQRVGGTARIDFRVEDAAGCTGGELAARLGAEADRPFDLERGPLLRVVLFQDGAGGYRLLVVVHHIVTDFWTMRVLLREIAALYEQERGGEPAELAPLPLAFADHVAAERDRLAGPEGQRLWAYWSEQLRDAPLELELATDRPRGRVQGFRGASEFLRLPAELSEAVRGLARARGVTAHAVLLAAYQVLLHRHSGQRDLLVGVPAAGRTGPEWAGVAGYFVNPLPIRARFAGDPRFGELVAQAQAATVGALEHQSYPFPLLAQRLQPERDPARPPLVQALFAWHAPDGSPDASLGAFALGEAGAVARLGDLVLESMRLERGSAAFDLSLQMSEVDGCLLASLQYDSDLFDRATAAGLLQHLGQVLADATANPERRVGEIEILSDAERAELSGWNATGARYGEESSCLHELFEAQAARTPEAVAVAWGEETWSYRRLNARATAIAAELRARGVGPEVRVGVCARRTPALVAGLLGVMKAGGAYVPVDPAYPRERQTYMLRDAGVAVVLGDEAAEECAAGVPVVSLEAGEREEALAPQAGPGNLAYVIYTSGSTGQPKGVSIEHRSAVAFACWAREVFEAAELEGVLASTSVCFDLSVFELFVTLAWGGTVVLAENVLELPRLAGASRVRLVNTVPSGLAELVRTGGVPATVRTVNLAGEPLPGTLVEEVYARTGVRRVLNLYGPSEDTTYSTGAEIARGERMPPIGAAIANTQAHVADAQGRLTPVGVPGELYLGGAGLARGYWSRPGLTAERFVPDPFGGAPGARLYRTGDQVRRRRTGALEFLGRRDHQVKVRGFRIELGEIDAVLRGHPSVLESVVVVREDVPGDRRLVAYVAGNPEVPADAAALRAHLEQRLPAYMVPPTFVWLERLPLSPTGKIDRAALPAPDEAGVERGAYAPPRTPAEEVLAGIYAEVLGVERVGVRDSFFDLGGHSLLATRVVSRVRELLGAELPLPTLFESPTVERLAAALARAGAPELPAVVPIPRAGGVPLSFAQERLWFLDRLQPGGSAYNLPAALRLRGPLDERALERSLAELVRRHESLRTTFGSEGGEPVQVIHPPREWVLVVEDLSTLPAGEREREAGRHARVEAERPFDLAAGPLFRARLLRLGDGEHVLLLVVHHVVFDGWSTGVLLRELGAIYTAFARGRPSPLPEPGLQYADYAGWQGEHLRSGRLDAQLAYWRERLSGAPALLELPTDRPRPAAPSHRGAVEHREVPAALARRLRALGRQEGATPFMVLLAAFQLLLSKHSGEEDVVVGSPIAGRTRAELEGLVGFFVNTLALRTDLSGDPSFRELLGRVRGVTLGAYAHQELPFERLVQDVAPERSLGHAPLFQVMLSLQNAPREELRLDGVEVEWLALEDTAAKFDLSLFAGESGDALELSLQYATDLLDASTARRMLEHLGALLEGAAAHPDRRLSELEMLGGSERAQLVREWSGTAAAHPHACIHTLFARQAAATPERTALVHGAERVGYAELDTRANRLAHHLRAAGAGPEVRVGVLLERTPEMVVALLAVLKAGGAYVPLDAANPAERLGYMIEDAQVSLVLTTTALAERLPGSAAAVLRLDTLGPELERQPAEAPESGVLPANLSHVIFTSGSTGRPKGVMIRHSGASVLLHWMRETVTDHERSCALFSTSISFDVSVAELFGTLCWGGTAVLVENALELATVSEPVVYASMVPTAAAELLRTGGVPRSVRTLNLAGEALSGELAQGLYALGTVEKVGNVYGPTEDTTYSTCSVVPKGALEVRIGRPLPGTRTYVLDAHLNPVPVGVAGELYLAGEGVARGYASRPDLTAERFVPDPFGPPGTRMYRTQDRVRWRADGELEYFGRTDHQVKVRGFRVELGEIGAVLGAHPAVAEAVVVARPHGGDLRLVAYVVPRPGAPADDAALRVHLEGRLPAYMVPATLVWLDRLPLTSTGKIDRNALPEPEWGHAATASLTPPRTPVEQVLAEQWREVLGVERVGRESNFFQLGGHSLLATRVVSRLREVFGVELPVRALFERPTLAGLAERIEAARRTERPAPPPIVRRPHDGEAPLSFAQERLWLLEQMQPGTTANNIARPLSLTGPLHVRALEDALAEVVRRHETLRTTFASAGGRPVQKIAPTAGCALRIVDLESVAGGERTAVAARLIAEESGRTLDLSAGPLFRATLLRCGAEDHTLLLTMHHIVSDGWSLGVLVGEVAELYRAFSAGGPSPLAPLPVQYSDYCRWQREWLQGDVLEAELRYWRDRLGGPQPLLELPADRPRGAVRGTRGAIRHQRLPAPLVEELDRLAVGSGASPFMALLAGFVSLLNRYTGQEDVRVGTFIANRTRAEVEPLFGFFLNNLVLRTGVAPDDTFRTLLGQVRDVTLDAYAHQEVPFEKVLEAVNPERALSHTPLFQVMFVLQNTPIPPLQLRDLSVRVLPVETTGSNFDMTLWVEETDGLRLSLQYDADLFDGTTIERLLGHLAALLQAAVSDPDVPLHRVALLGAGERHALLVEANDTGPAPAADRHGVHGLVEARARVAPDAVAVRQGGAALTYRELNRTANRLAHHLRARGAGPETRVALLADRSPRMIAGLLGILKSGAAYVPLDPRAPVDRLAHILKDLGAGVLVADDALVGGLGAHVPGVVGLDGAWAHEDGAPEHDPAPLGGGSDAAYVIYTSGSTGRPKGVLVEHRSLRAYTETAIGQYGIGPQDRLLQFASVSFDASIEEIFPALASGATLVLRDDVMLGSPPLFWEACAREGVTVANLPTAYWHELAGALGGGPSPLPACVRLVIIGGERALSERVARWQRVVGPAVRLVNTYGPTEATVVATLRDLTGWRAGAGRDVPIGRPVRSATAYVLGSDGHPMPAGVPGELYLGGAGLARGYLDRPALTAERFVPDPFAAEPGARLYRTGDLARFLPAGELEFVGRGDGQVKIRGYRVELQEVEARLAEHPAVGAAAVVLRRSGEGEPYLAAFVVWSQAEPPTTADLRTFVGESLPEYMVPSLVVSLDALPMTPGGKVDARALPATDRPREEASGGYVAPRTPTEEILASIWAQVLGVERVGVNDSFFELGGYSLLATQVIARIRDAFGVELPLVKLFQARTLADLAGSITDASQTLLPEVERVSRDGPLPLSFAQERIWFLTQLAPELSAYHVPRALRIRGPLVPGAIEQSYGALVARHEVLRTTFPSVGGRPVQVIHPPAPVPVPVVDLSGLPGPVREEEVQRIIVEVGRKRFDLANGPLIRVVLLRLGADEHVVVQAEHHLVHDGWAEGVLMRDLLGSFSAFVEGRPAALPELPIQFADYAAWQRRWVDGPVLEEQLGYWKAQLAGAPAVLELPTDRPRPPVQRFQGGEELLPLSVATVAALREMGRREGVTLFMAALAGFNALLHRYSGQDDIVVGTVLANRRWREAEGLLGMILNTLPLRTSLQGDPTVRELLGTVRQTCLGAYGHQDAPFEMIVDAVRPQRNLSYPAVFQVMFAFHDARMPMLEAPGFVLTGLDAHNRSSKFDMLVIVQADPAPEGEERGMTAAIEYNSDLFDAATIQRFARHFENLLRILPASLDLRLSELPLMDDAERAELSGWNATGARYGEESSCLHELFEAQAARTPEAVAVAWGEETWSYRRLNARATAIAAELRARGVGPEVRVGVCARRTPALVAGLLGVMKAGGAYVPVDPAYPRERQAYMLRDAGVAVVLGDEAAEECAAGVPVVSLEAGEREETLAPQAGPGNLAYVIYTSGSTGQPKGVSIEHRSAVAFACWAREVFEAAELEGVLASTSVCFDLSVFELFVTLAWGGTVVLAENVLELPRLAGASRVRLVNTVPSGLAELVRTGGVPASVRTVNLAGEPLPGTLVEEVYARTGVRRVLNLYGPSEDTTYSTGAEIARGERMPPIGAAIANTQAHVADAQGRLTPVGVPGELYLGGAGLARGYWSRPGLTAERFVPDPFGGVAGARLYRTGDQVRRRRTGALEFLGRRDHQVKVRGFRIELGEIDAVLRAHPSVLESVVVVREDVAGDRRLVAYVAGNPEVPADAAALRAHLEQRLPAYMVPPTFVWLERLPLSPTGKIDRAALPAPEAPRVDAEAEDARPQSDLARAIAGVWAEVLGLEKVGLRSNFFDLGGHSLLALRAQHRLSEVLGRDVSVIDVFRHPTVESLAEKLRGAAGSAIHPAPRSTARPAGDRAPDIAIIGWAGRFPGAPGVEALWRNVCAGIESVSFFSDAELLAAGVDPEQIRDPSYVRAKGVLDDIESFDAAFFDVGPREAEITDPQHRLFLECAWEALEDAAYDPQRYPGSVGVFAGAGVNGYWLNVYSDPEVARTTGHTAIRLGNEKDFLPTRVSYKLGLRGPSVNVQTACSTSLVAVHLACQSLIRGECDMALAGAASVAAQQKTGYLYNEGGVHSPDGHCRAFDAAAQGTVGGNGVGIVVLKPLHEALADRDHVYAVIRGSAINNDGSVKAGFTAPGVDGQAQVIAAAQRAAGVTPGEIGYVEAHGTGTPIGDPIEFAALAQVFGEGREHPCAIGSIKTNIGHLDAASGVVGLIKAALAVRDGVLPPSLHFERMNPRIAASGALEVNGRLRDWTGAPLPRRAGVSSFGLGGTNAHVVVEQPAPVEPPAPWTRPAHLLVVSARTQPALETAAGNLGRRLREGGDDLADVAYTLQVGRGAFAYRRVVVCEGREDGALALESGRGALDGRAGESASVAFQFPGEGAAHVGMGQELYRSEQSFRTRVDLFADLFRRELDVDLREALYPSAEGRAGAEALLERASVAGAALFTTQAALAELWMGWGVRPDAMIGHGAGEYAAAYVAGVFTAEDAVRLIARRGRSMERGPAGATLADSAAAAVEELSGEVGRMALQRPRIPFVSTVTGTWIREREATDPAYWVRHPRDAARFDEGLRTLLEEPRHLVEVGPGRTLTDLAIAHPDRAEGVRALPSLVSAGSEGSEWRAMLEALGCLWLEGVAPDWAAYHRHAPRSRVSLPTYPFQRQRYWIAARTDLQRQAPQPMQTAPQKVEDVGQWFYVPSWKPAPLPAPSDSAADGAGQRWLLFVDEGRVGAPLAEALARSGAEVATVAIGERFAAGPDGYAVDPGRPEDYRRLVDDLAARGALPHRVVHLWNVVPLGDGGAGPAAAGARERGFDSLLHLTQALVAAGADDPLRIDVVTTEVQSVDGREPLCPEKATVLGICRVAPQERRSLSCRSIDLALPPRDPGRDQAVVADLMRELRSDSSDRLVAYRRGVRWAEAFARIQAPPQAARSRLRQGGVYLIAGGLGRIGQTTAEWLAREVGARLVLTSRSGVADREAVRALEAAGAEVLVLRCDLGDEAQVRQVVDTTIERFGALHGVIHAAGVVGERAQRALEETGPEACAEQFAAKVDGLRVLERVIGALPLDFCLLFSSLSPILGGLGYTAYSAANHFVDAFARARSRDGGFPWTSVAWDAWRFAGAAPHADGIGITPAEGMEALPRALGLVGLPYLVISTADLDARRAEWVTGPRPAPLRSAAPAHERPMLFTEFVAPGTPDEQAVAEVWSQLLGIGRIGVHDGFFELGGTSLLATQVTSRLRQTVQVDVPLRAFLEMPTVADLARLVEALRADPAPAEPELAAGGARSIEDELDELTNLSDEQVAALIERVSPSATAE